MAQSAIQEAVIRFYVNQIGFQPDEIGHEEPKRFAYTGSILLIVGTFLYLLVGHSLGYSDMSWLLITLLLWIFPSLRLLFACFIRIALVAALLVSLFIIR